MSADAYHMTGIAPEGAGAQRSMRAALKERESRPRKWGTSMPTRLRLRQATATNRGPSRSSSANTRSQKKLKVSGTKSMTGHLLGGAGGLEAGITVLALQHQMLPPTINLDNVDPECRLDYVPNKAVPHSFDVALSNSFGFGGINATLIMRRWDRMSFKSARPRPGSSRTAFINQGR